MVWPAKRLCESRWYHLPRSHRVGCWSHRKLLLAVCCYLSDLRDRSVCLGVCCGPSRTTELEHGAEFYHRDCRSAQLGRVLQMPVCKLESFSGNSAVKSFWTWIVPESFLALT